MPWISEETTQQLQKYLQKSQDKQAKRLNQKISDDIVKIQELLEKDEKSNSAFSQNDLVGSVSLLIVSAYLFISLLFGFDWFLKLDIGKDKTLQNARSIKLAETPISGNIIPVGLPNVKFFDLKICGISAFLYELEYDSEILKNPEVINHLTEIFEKSEDRFKIVEALGGSYLVYTKDKKTGKTINVNREMVKFLANKYIQMDDNKHLSFDPDEYCKDYRRVPRATGGGFYGTGS